MTKRSVRYSTSERQEILAKTGGRCHVCGDKIGSVAEMDVDHVGAVAYSGDESMSNCLPAHPSCNTKRWSRKAWAVPVLMDLAVFAAEEIRRGTGLGKTLEKMMENKMRTRNGRRTTMPPDDVEAALKILREKTY